MCDSNGVAQRSIAGRHTDAMKAQPFGWVHDSGAIPGERIGASRSEKRHSINWQCYWPIGDESHIEAIPDARVGHSQECAIGGLAGMPTFPHERANEMTKYMNVIYLDGDGYEEAMEACGGETGISVHKADETWLELFNYLMQWEYGEPTEELDGTPWGSADDSAAFPGYIVSWNHHLGYCSLTRLVDEN